MLRGYSILRKDRRERVGGGCLIFVKEYSNAVIIKDLPTPLAEMIWCKLVVGSKKLVFDLCYRPNSPTSNPDSEDVNCGLIREACRKYKDVVL